MELTDLAPTLCEAAGLPAFEGFQGKSFWKLLTGETDLHTHRSSVYSEYYNSNINHRDPLAFATMVCDGRYKLVRVHGDLGKTADGMAEVKMRLLETMCDRMAQTCDPLPVRKACW